MGRIGDWATIEDFAKTDRQMLALAAHRPRLARLVMSVASRAALLSPKRALASFDKELAPPDRELLLSTGRDAASIMTVFTQAFLRGARGVVDDYRAVGAPSVGFRTDARGRSGLDLAPRRRHDGAAVARPGPG